MRRTLRGHSGESGSRAASRARLSMARWLLLFSLIWSTMAAANTGDRTPEQFYIQRDGEHLTLRAQEVPQQELLEALAQRLEFELILMGPLPQPRSLHIEGRPWEQALKQVLPPASWVLQYVRVAGQDRLVQVVVFPSESRPQLEQRTGYEPAAPEPPRFVEVDRSAAGKEDQAQDAQSVEQQNTTPPEQHTQESQSEPRGDYDNSATSQ